jgi:phosphoglycolate phosphatase
LGFCEQTGLTPAEVAVVGDSTHDLEMARAAGAGLCVGVLTGPATHDDLAHLADVVLGSAVELAAYLEG